MSFSGQTQRPDGDYLRVCMCWVILVCILIDTNPLAGLNVCNEFTTMLNHDSVSHPRFRSTNIVPLTVPRSSTVRDAAPGPVAGCISPRIETYAQSPA